MGIFDALGDIGKTIGSLTGSIFDGFNSLGEKALDAYKSTYGNYMHSFDSQDALNHWRNGNGQPVTITTPGYMNNGPGLVANPADYIPLDTFSILGGLPVGSVYHPADYKVSYYDYFSSLLSDDYSYIDAAYVWGGTTFKMKNTTITALGNGDYNLTGDLFPMDEHFDFGPNNIFEVVPKAIAEYVSGNGIGYDINFRGNVSRHIDITFDQVGYPNGVYIDNTTNTLHLDGLLKPVILDLASAVAGKQNSDGLSFLGLYNSPVFYNSDADKFKERTAWVGPNEGIVVFTEKDGSVKDINHDGKITVAEIALTKVVTNTRTDMEALYKGFDKGYMQNGKLVGKGDHRIEAKEADAHGLRIWQDANVNGVIDTGEMKTFADAGIDFIDLNDTNIDTLKQAKDGARAGADDIIETRFSDGSVIFGTAQSAARKSGNRFSVRSARQGKPALANGDTTTAYDVGFAHESTGMLDHEDANGMIDKVKLERPKDVAKSDWDYREAGNGAVNWNFGEDSTYYGATGSSGNDVISYKGTGDRSFSGGAGNDKIATGDGDDFLIGGAGADRLDSGRGNDVLACRGVRGTRGRMREWAQAA